MKIQSKHTIASILFIATIILAMPFIAQAGGTAPGVTISNTATINYSVNSQAQLAIGSSPTGNTSGAGTATTFVVDDKVIVSVANVGPVVNTSPGASGLHAMLFTVTNGGNSAHDFVITATNIADTMTGGPATATLYEDTDGNGVFNPAIDQIFSSGTTVYLKNSAGTAYIDEMPVDATRNIFVVVNTPAGATNAQTANFSLTADAHQGSGPAVLGALTKTQADIDKLLDKNANLNTQYVVLAESAGDGADIAHDGKFTKDGAAGFTVQAVALTVLKTATVFSDPINGTTLPKAIPLALVDYTIRVTYTAGGSGTATGLTLSDNVPANTVAQVSVYAGNTEVEKTTSISGVVVTTNLDSTVLTAPQAWGTAAGANIKVDCGVTLAAAGDYCQIKYRVQIQ